ERSGTTAAVFAADIGRDLGVVDLDGPGDSLQPGGKGLQGPPQGVRDALIGVEALWARLPSVRGPSLRLEFSLQRQHAGPADKHLLGAQAGGRADVLADVVGQIAQAARPTGAVIDVGRQKQALSVCDRGSCFAEVDLCLASTWFHLGAYTPREFICHRFLNCRIYDVWRRGSDRAQVPDIPGSSFGHCRKNGHFVDSGDVEVGGVGSRSSAPRSGPTLISGSGARVQGFNP